MKSRIVLPTIITVLISLACQALSQSVTQPPTAQPFTFTPNAISTGTSTTVPTATFRAPAKGHIIFVSNLDDPDPENCNKEEEFGCIWGVYSIKADGSEQQLLMQLPSKIGAFIYSPDGKQIVFETIFREGTNFQDIYVMNSDGSGKILVAEEAQGPSWSPDGKRISYINFTQYHPEINFGIYTIGADGTDATKVIPLNLDICDQPYTNWSPDGTKIAFSQMLSCPNYNNANNQIFVVNIDGSHLTQLTSSSGSNNSPVWSPDTSRIAFVSTRNNLETYTIYVMNSDGSNQIQLTENNSWEPRWSPDGNHIAFLSDVSGETEIYSIASDGSGLIQITSNNAVEYLSAWLPDN